MTDYNDGNWHGWNGGECPVHPLSVVDVVFDDGLPGLSRTQKTAREYYWSKNTGIIAFRVTRPHVEPRVMWVWLGGTYDTREAAETWRDGSAKTYPDYGYADMPITKWQEVPE